MVPVVGYELSIWLMAGTLQQPVARAGFFTHDLETDNFCFVSILAVDCKLLGLRPGEKFSFTDIRATSLFKKCWIPLFDVNCHVDANDFFMLQFFRGANCLPFLVHLVVRPIDSHCK